MSLKMKYCKAGETPYWSKVYVKINGQRVPGIEECNVNEGWAKTTKGKCLTGNMEICFIDKEYQEKWEKGEKLVEKRKIEKYIPELGIKYTLELDNGVNFRLVESLNLDKEVFAIELTDFEDKRNETGVFSDKLETYNKLELLNNMFFKRDYEKE